MAATRNKVAVIVLVAVLCTSVGVGAGLILAPTPVPDVVQANPGETVLDVTPQPFDDARTMQAAVTLTQQITNTTAASGVVRSSACVVGSPMNSGQAVLTINDQPIIALHLDSPPFRSLAQGDKGTDVADFQRELNRLGFATAEDGAYSAATAKSTGEFWASLGVTKRTSLPLEAIVWIDAPTVTPTSCPLGFGQTLNSGDTVFITGGHPTALTLDPSGIDLSTRVASLSGGETAPIIDGTITDTAFLTALQHTVTYLQWQSDTSAPIPVTTRLTSPEQVVAVPPSSLYDVVGTRACLIAEDGLPRAVEILGSQLGQTFVVADPLPRSVAVPAPEGSPSCS